MVSPNRLVAEVLRVSRADAVATKARPHNFTIQTRSMSPRPATTMTYRVFRKNRPRQSPANLRSAILHSNWSSPPRRHAWSYLTGNAVLSEPGQVLSPTQDATIGMPSHGSDARELKSVRTSDRLTRPTPDVNPKNAARLVFEPPAVVGQSRQDRLRFAGYQHTASVRGELERFHRVPEHASL